MMNTGRDRFELDYNGEQFTVPAGAGGWTEVTWVGDGVANKVIAYRHADGPVMVPSDCDADADEHVRDGKAVAGSRWHDIRTGESGMVLGVCPHSARSRRFDVPRPVVQLPDAR